MPGCDPYKNTDIISMIESKSFNIGDRLRNQTIFTIECSTGARINEILKLKRKDILDRSGSIRKQIAFTDTKNKTTITADLINPLPLSFLQQWLKHIEALGFMRYDSPLFPSPYINKQAISARQIYNIYDAAHKELKLSGHYATHSCRKTWVKETYQYYEAKRRSGENIDPLMKLFATGRWKTMDAMSRYCKFIMGDTRESQQQIYSEVADYFKKKISEKYQTGNFE